MQRTIAWAIADFDVSSVENMKNGATGFKRLQMQFSSQTAEGTIYSDSTFADPSRALHVEPIRVISFAPVISLCRNNLESVGTVLNLLAGSTLSTKHLEYMNAPTRSAPILHQLGIIHRDIKPANLLVNSQCILKICDLRLCRILPEKLVRVGGFATADETHAWTLQNCVGTSFYRAPELLLGDRGDGEAIDTWAVGCVLAKLLTGKPLFPGQEDIEQLGFITNLLGSPDETRWPGFSQVADFGQIVFKEKDAHDIRQAFPTWSDHAVGLFKKFMTYEPGKRISARDALN
jgi:serine/threonine protein kinase